LRVYDRVRPGLCERFSGAIVSGTYDGFFVIDTHVDLETLWGRSARELRDRLRTATAPIDKFRVLEAALLARLSGSVIRHGAVRFALHAFGGSNPTTVRDVSERVGLSQRRFSEVFKTEVGLTPKLLHRVQRFQRVLALARRATAPDWSRLALDCGFFDQSHLIRDFVAFSGFSPAEFLRHQQALQRRGIHLKRNHLPLAAYGSMFSNTLTAHEATMTRVALSATNSDGRDEIRTTNRAVGDE